MNRDVIPRTANNLPAMGCLSAMQKYIRRSAELDAMRFAVELHRTSKAFCSMVCNRLEVISHEDIDILAAPHVVPFVHAATDQARLWWDREKLGKSRMAIGNAIRLLCAAPKSRIGDHFHAAVGLAAELEGFVPQIPDFANDHHTIIGRRRGRGLDYFRSESTKLVQPRGLPEIPADPYESEAYRLWALKQAIERTKKESDHED